MCKPRVSSSQVVPIVLALVVAACGPDAIEQPTAGSSAEPPPTAAADSALPSEAPLEVDRLPGDLVLEAHRLKGPPDSDRLSFVPVVGTREQVLLRHAEERRQQFPNQLTFMEGNPALSAPWDSGVLLATLSTEEEGKPEQVVRLFEGEKLVFSAPAGLPSPALPLQGLWTYDGHWALEILYSAREVWEGRVYIDGELLSEVYGYDETFGFQLLAGRPFYFFRRSEGIWISYDGQETALPFGEIPHYMCCAESVLNPIQAENMVAFFARTHEAWYYVELGAFGSPGR